MKSRYLPAWICQVQSDSMRLRAAAPTAGPSSGSSTCCRMMAAYAWQSTISVAGGSAPWPTDRSRRARMRLPGMDATPVGVAWAVESISRVWSWTIGVSRAAVCWFASMASGR